jgi:hypothetical protein
MTVFILENHNTFFSELSYICLFNIIENNPVRWKCNSEGIIALGQGLKLFKFHFIKDVSNLYSKSIDDNLDSVYDMYRQGDCPVLDLRIIISTQYIEQLNFRKTQHDKRQAGSSSLLVCLRIVD